jgi:hypothetical protein
MPAEVAYDALLLATASEEEIARLEKEPTARAIGLGVDTSRGGQRRGSNYVFAVFGKPDRSTNCDCERSSEPSLLQTIYLRNDSEMLGNIERKGGWISSLGGEAKPQVKESNAGKSRAEEYLKGRDPEEVLARIEKRAKQLRKAEDKEELAKVEDRIAKLKRLIKAQETRTKAAQRDQRAQADAKTVVSIDSDKVVREAYLRTLSRLPNDEESALAQRHINEAKTPIDGAKDLMWALLNTKEFIINH